MDNRDITPGNKYYDWELKGVPVRIEVGPRDVEKKEIIIVRRDTQEKISIPKEEAIEKIKDTFDKISKNLYDNAKNLLKNNLHRVTTVEEAKKLKGIVELPWCKNEDCALQIENILDGNTLGEPIESIKCKNTCPICGKPALTWMRFAKSY